MKTDVVSPAPRVVKPISTPSAKGTRRSVAAGTGAGEFAQPVDATPRTDAANAT